MSNKGNTESSIFLSLLSVLFIGLKLTNFITWSWWWVLSPLWLPVILVVIIIIIIFVVSD